jgi:ligand-binding sensor domain-containing protein
LSGNEVTALCEDKFGNLWVGTSGGLNKYNSELENFTRYIYPGDSSTNANYIRSMCEDNSGNIWLGTHHGGLYRFDPETEEFISYVKFRKIQPA